MTECHHERLERARRAFLNGDISRAEISKELELHCKAQGKEMSDELSAVKQIAHIRAALAGADRNESARAAAKVFLAQAAADASPLNIRIRARTWLASIAHRRAARLHRQASRASRMGNRRRQLRQNANAACILRRAEGHARRALDLTRATL